MHSRTVPLPFLRMAVGLPYAAPVPNHAACGGLAECLVDRRLTVELKKAQKREAMDKREDTLRLRRANAEAARCGKHVQLPNPASRFLTWPGVRVRCSQTWVTHDGDLGVS